MPFTRLHWRDNQSQRRGDTRYLHRVSDRFPCHVLVWPVRVQGETCAEEVARAIAGFNALPVDGNVARPDVLIVARGGAA